MSPGVREDGSIAQKYAHFSAIPAILYDTEAMVLTKKVLNKLDSLKHQVARFVPQSPKSSSKCAGYMHAGLKSMKERVEIKLGPYVWDLMHRKQDKVLKNVFSLFTSHQIIHGTIREPRSQKSEATVNEGSRGKSDANKANSGINDTHANSTGVVQTSTECLRQHS